MPIQTGFENDPDGYNGKKCPSCNKPVSDNDLFCPHCDAKLAVLCPHCGKRLDKEDDYCPNCGACVDDFKDKYDFDSDFRETMVL